MTESPCFNCKYKRYGKDLENKLRDCLGFYVCVEDPVIAVVMSDSAVEMLRVVGCPKREEVGDEEK
jgi:hypothetical protein